MVLYFQAARPGACYEHHHWSQHACTQPACRHPGGALLRSKVYDRQPLGKVAFATTPTAFRRLNDLTDRLDADVFDNLVFDQIAAQALQ